MHVPSPHSVRAHTHYDPRGLLHVTTHDTTTFAIPVAKGCAHWRDYQLKQQQERRRQLRSTPNRSPSWIQAAARATELFGGRIGGQQSNGDK